MQENSSNHQERTEKCGGVLFCGFFILQELIFADRGQSAKSAKITTRKIFMLYGISNSQEDSRRDVQLLKECPLSKKSDHIEASYRQLRMIEPQLRDQSQAELP